MSDPTYVKAEIDTNPTWRLAWLLSEVDNDNAPIGWFRYIHMAIWLCDCFEMIERRSNHRAREEPTT